MSNFDVIVLAEAHSHNLCTITLENYEGEERRRTGIIRGADDEFLFLESLDDEDNDYVLPLSEVTNIDDHEEEGTTPAYACEICNNATDGKHYDNNYDMDDVDGGDNGGLAYFCLSHTGCQLLETGTGLTGDQASSLCDQCWSQANQEGLLPA